MVKARELDERQHNTREKNMRDSIASYYLSPSCINIDIIPDGMMYAWKPINCNGKPLSNQFEMSSRLGWKPVPKSRHPELSVSNELMRIIDKDRADDDHVHDRGRILMEIPLEQFEAIQQANLEFISQQQRFAHSLNSDMHDDNNVHYHKPTSFIEDPHSPSFRSSHRW